MNDTVSQMGEMDGTVLILIRALLVSTIICVGCLSACLGSISAALCGARMASARNPNSRDSRDIAKQVAAEACRDAAKWARASACARGRAGEFASAGAGASALSAEASAPDASLMV